MPYIQFNFKIPSELASKLPALKHSRSCSSTSEYIRELIQLDLAGHIPNAGANTSQTVSDSITKQLDAIIVNAKNEILQRLLIQTKTTLELFVRSFPKQLPADQIQASLNGFAEEAAKRYPLDK